MNESSESLGRKIKGARELGAVVRTMKALAAAHITQYEKAVLSLADYYRAVELGLTGCLRRAGRAWPGDRGIASREDVIGTGAIVFGSDRGLVGQFNEHLAQFVVGQLSPLHGNKMVWSVGERLHARLLDEGFDLQRPRALPNVVTAITGLVVDLLIDLEKQCERRKIEQVLLFHHRPTSGAACEPVSHRILPLDTLWCRRLEALQWPTNQLPQVWDNHGRTLPALVREYLFVSLYKACAESLASENARRLAAMQRATRNIDELLERLEQDYHRARQRTIDEELFELIAGFEALSHPRSAGSWTIGDPHPE